MILLDKGTHHMFLEYAMDNPGVCYQMFNPKTGHIQMTHDDILLKRMFHVNPSYNEEHHTNPMFLKIQTAVMENMVRMIMVEMTEL